MTRQRSGAWVHPSRTQIQASTNIDILSSTGRLKVPNPFSTADSTSDVIGDLFGSRAGGTKNTELFGSGSPSPPYSGTGVGTSASMNYVGAVLLLQNFIDTVFSTIY